jgi:Na+/melibiose symporter-like transporter
MLAAEDAGTASVYGWYNATGSAAGALGSLAVTLAGLGAAGTSRIVHGWFFLALVPVGVAGVLVAARLSPSVEPAPSDVRPGGDRPRHSLGRSRSIVRWMAGLFAVDAAGGGLVTTGFLSYYFTERYHVSVVALGWLFFAVSVVQAASVAVAPLLARRFGLVATMVGTHLPSNVLLASVAFAPVFPVAVVLLLARTTLSQMDVPTRQALVMTVVTPDERTAAAAMTNASRYTVRPVGPLIAGLLQVLALGAPLLAAGTVKAGYDIALWVWARRLGLASRHPANAQVSRDAPETPASLSSKEPP